MSSDMSERLHALYRFFDASGDLLYIGITLNPAGRWKQHREDKPWWEEVADITIETFPDRFTVLEAERAAIIAEHPRYNKTHNERPIERSPEPSIVWICSECGEDVADDGYIQVGCTGQELAEIGRAHREYEARRRTRSSWAPVDMTEVFELPRPAPWRPVHGRCDQIGEATPHWIYSRDVRTYRDLLVWTCHLASKSWIDNTDWFRFVDRAANAGAPTIKRKGS